MMKFVTALFCKAAARRQGVPRMHLFLTLGRHPRLFWSWLLYSGILLGLGKLPRQYTELVILRTAYLRGCEYELQHHCRIAKRYGLDDELQDAIFSGVHDPRLSYHQKALVSAVDEFVHSRTLWPDTHAWLANFLDQKRVIELCMLIGHYDDLAAIISALRVPTDYPLD